MIRRLEERIDGGDQRLDHVVEEVTGTDRREDGEVRAARGSCWCVPAGRLGRNRSAERRATVGFRVSAFLFAITATANVDDPLRFVPVRVALRQDDLPIITIGLFQCPAPVGTPPRCARFLARRPQRAARVVHIQQAPGNNGAGARIPIRPQADCSRPAANVHAAVPARSATNSQVASPAWSTAGAEKDRPEWRWGRIRFLFPSAMRRGASDLLQGQEADLAVFASLRDIAAAEDHGRGRPDIKIGLVERLGVRRRLVGDEIRRIRIEHKRRVTPIRLAIPIPIARGDENLASRIDDCTRTTPDRRAALRT